MTSLMLTDNQARALLRVLNQASASLATQPMCGQEQVIVEELRTRLYAAAQRDAAAQVDAAARVARLALPPATSSGMIGTSHV